MAAQVVATQPFAWATPRPNSSQEGAGCGAPTTWPSGVSADPFRSGETAVP
jgi:hypothetical protein